MKLQELAGYDLGSHELRFDERDTILYAIAVGASSRQLDLVYERYLCALPTHACALGLWAVEAAGRLGAYDRERTLHSAQTLEMHEAMPARGPVASRGRIASVWDKGKAAIVNVEVTSAVFTATYGLFLPGLGGWGGERGPAGAASDTTGEAVWTGSYATCREHATLYRLTGDLHPVHIDPDVARANGFERPILHGLCSLGIASREVARAVDAHPAELKALEARLSAPVLPGETIDISAGQPADGVVSFEATVGGTAVIKSGRAAF